MNTNELIDRLKGKIESLMRVIVDQFKQFPSDITSAGVDISACEGDMILHPNSMRALTAEADKLMGDLIKMSTPEVDSNNKCLAIPIWYTMHGSLHITIWLLYNYDFAHEKWTESLSSCHELGQMLGRNGRIDIVTQRIPRELRDVFDCLTSGDVSITEEVLIHLVLNLYSRPRPDMSEVPFECQMPDQVTMYCMEQWYDKNQKSISRSEEEDGQDIQVPNTRRITPSIGRKGRLRVNEQVSPVIIKKEFETLELVNKFLISFPDLNDIKIISLNGFIGGMELVYLQYESKSHSDDQDTSGEHSFRVQFDVATSVIQDVEIIDSSYSTSDVIDGLNNGTMVTTVLSNNRDSHKGTISSVKSGETIAKIIGSEESNNSFREYSNFKLV